MLRSLPMRDRLTDFFPLLLVGVVLVAFQLSRQGMPALPFQALPQPSPTPLTAATVAPAATAVPLPRANSTLALCNATQPRFHGGMAALKNLLGASMGEPLECEQSISPQGDTQQKTTTGLAYYRKQLNVACFTTGWDHWGLIQGGLVHWTGDAVDAPGNALVIAR